MIHGLVNPFLQAVITVTVQGVNGLQHDYSATIDTGFSGFLTLPSIVIVALGLPFIDMEHYTLGDGSDIEMRLHRAVIHWDGRARTILVVEANDDSLVGMEMLEGHTLFVDVQDGGEVRISRRD